MSFIEWPDPSPEAEAIFDDDRAHLGFVMNASRLWAHQPKLQEGIFALLGRIAEEHGLTFRQRGILVTACASTLGDSYCSVAWATKLANVTDEHFAAALLRGDDGDLSPADHALAAWSRKITRDPNSTTSADIATLRETGWTDRQILAITTFIALRLAFSTVNDALGARPDAEYRSVAPPTVLDAITYGRPFAD